MPETIDLARETVRIIRQNLFWAFFYNIGGIALASLGWLNPIWAAMAMVASSVLVIGNSLRLRGVPAMQAEEPFAASSDIIGSAEPLPAHDENLASAVALPAESVAVRQEQVA